jgi:hypothetical protein
MFSSGSLFEREYNHPVLWRLSESVPIRISTAENREGPIKTMKSMKVMKKWA